MSPESRLIVEEIYLARRATVELMRDAEPAVIDRINAAFCNEVKLALDKGGVSVEDEINRLNRADDSLTATVLSHYALKPQA
jgi:hypothetical protein